jgi:cytochrome c553
MRPVVLASLLAGLFAFGPSPCRAQVADSGSAVADSSAAPAAGEPAPPPARKLPGVDAPDPFPRGCVDCHVNTPERNLDTRLSTLMNGWTKEVTPALLAKAKASSPSGMPLKGKHPVAKSSLQNIPRGCVSCHGTASKKAPPLGRLMHQIHLTGGDDNRFMTLFQGECTNCHKLDATTGAWSIPSGPEPQAIDSGGH